MGKPGEGRRVPSPLPRFLFSLQHQLGLIDDLLATGGTVEATVKMIKELGGEPVGCAFIIELSDLHGRDALSGMEVLSLLTYEGE